jgi:large repetitive protein
MPLRGILALLLVGCGNDVSISKQRIDDDSDGYYQDVDCDDQHASVNPDAPELCDDLDNNCDGTVDEDSSDATVWYLDTDGDGWGEAEVSSCTQPDRSSTKKGDCDDTNASISPDDAEHCDGVDEDCDGTVDNDPVDASLWYTDADADGYGAALIGPACSGSAGQSALSGDCDDADGRVHPGASEPDCSDPTDYNCDGSVGYADADADGTPACQDCNDADASAHPGATEDCDGADDDCDGSIDNGVLVLFYRDADADAYGDAAQSTEACSAPVGYSADATDCDDADATIYPGAAEFCDGQDHDCDGLVLEAGSVDASLWYADSDGDSFGGGGGGGVYACTAPAGHIADGSDCDDTDATIHPGAPESCDGVDQDCDGTVDNNAVDATFWYADADADTFGNAARAQSACSAPTGYVADATDCDDAVSAVNPAATEVCDSANIDEDCDGLADDADSGATGQSRWYTDGDGDGAGGPGIRLSCDQPAGTYATSTDCNDADATVYPGALERCDAADLDEDCNGLADDDDPAVLGTRSWYLDADQDGYGGSTRLAACDSPAGYLSSSTDCNDGNASIHPAATEICDAANTDEDCDSLADDSDVSATGKSVWYADNDRDGYGGTGTTTACDQPSGYLSTSTDCNDTLAAVNPAATEICDATNTDEDCDGLADDLDTAATGKSTWYRDADGDGYAGSSSSSACDQPSGTYATSTDCNDSSAAINPGATEICDATNTDEDCDGLADDLDTAATGKTTWYRDVDGDGYAGSTPTSACDQPSGTYATSTDCNDASAAINPAATEICDATNTDEDCDGLADDLDTAATGKTTWYRDADGDGYGGSSTTSACDRPSGSLATSTDCNDSVAAINPGATEVCDASNTDEDCDGLADDGDPSATGTTTWYRDVDGDGYGGSTTTTACDQPSGTYATSTDCNDGSAAISPAATEICDAANTDEDCDGLADDNDSAASGKTTWYRDVDGDGYAGSTTTSACDQPSGAYATSTDCNDSSASIRPGGTEICDASNTDEDCDGLADDNDPSATGQTSWYTDADGDGYAGTSSSFCDQPAGSSSSSTDCNDASSSINPAATEVCGDGIDQNCTGGDLACVQWSGTYSVGSSYYTRITGFNTTANLGTGLAAGDFDGDGVGDLLVGDPDYNYSTYWGTLFGYYGPLLPGSWQAALHDDFLFYDTVSTYSNHYAERITNIGDISSDGKDDFVVLGVSSTSLLYYGGDTGTATHAANLDRTLSCSHTAALGDWQSSSPAVEWLCGNESYSSNTGIVYVYSGTSTSALGSYVGESSSDGAGSALGAGDFDGDGLDDFVAGASLDDDSGADAGAVYIVLAASSSITSLSAADVKIRGAAAADYFGRYLEVLPDVNGDGYADLAVGAPYQDGAATNAGAVYLVTQPTTGAVNSMAWATITGSAASQLLGMQGIERGDFDGNGLDDLAVSSIYYNSSAGAVWLFYTPTSGTYSVTTADALWPGISSSDNFGYGVVAVPDTNGDGKDDLAISAPNGDSSVGANMGTVWFWLAP